MSGKSLNRGPTRRSLMIGGSATVALAATAMSAIEVRSASEIRLSSARLRVAYDLKTSGTPTAVIWSPDGTMLATASNYGQDIAIWTNSGDLKAQFKRNGGGPYTFNSIAFVDGSSRLLFPCAQTADESAALSVWDISTGQATVTVRGPAPSEHYERNRAYYFAVAPNQERAVAAPLIGGAIAGYTTRDWNARWVSHIEFGVTSISYSHDGLSALVGANHGRWSVLDAASGKLIKQFAPYDTRYANVGISAIAGSPSSREVVIGTGLITVNGEYTQSAEAAATIKSYPPLCIWNTVDGERLKTFPKVCKPPIRQAAWDPLNRFVAFVDSAGTLFLWEQGDHEAAVATVELSAPTLSLAIDPGSKRIAVAYRNGTRVFEII